MTSRTDVPFVPVPFTDRDYYAPCCKPYTRAEYAERIGEKLCPKCEAIKPLEDFHLGGATANRHSYCRDCRSDYYRTSNRERRGKAVAA